MIVIIIITIIIHFIVFLITAWSPSSHPTVVTMLVLAVRSTTATTLPTITVTFGVVSRQIHHAPLGRLRVVDRESRAGRCLRAAHSPFGAPGGRPDSEGHTPHAVPTESSS
jgi:hypothetical protein